MKRRFLGFVLLMLFMMGISMNVNALEKDTYYVTKKGIELTEEEYHFLTRFYWDEYPDIMSQKQYEEFKKSDLLTRELRVKTTQDTGNSKSPLHETQYKKLKISAACSSYDCNVNIHCYWKQDPAIRSWDVIGAYLSGITLGTHIQTYVSSSNGTSYYTNLNTTNSAIGNSVKLPSSGSSLNINTNFTTSRGGNIYGSYQHAMSNTTLAVSQLYYFSLGGYGNVFAFYGSAYGVYDGMAGVDLSV